MPRQKSTIPPEIARFRQPGMQIKRIKGKFYLQRVTSRWDKEAGKVRKVVLEHLGMVTPDGVVPKRTRRIPAGAAPYSKEFGATWAVAELTADIRAALSRHFPEDAGWLYATALLKCVRQCANRYVEHGYGVSFLSERMPGLRLSSQSLNNLMTSLGCRRRQMVAFMREFVPSRDWFVLVDGSAVVCSSENIRDAQRGYNGHGCHDPQVNLIYAVAVKDGKRVPVFYKHYPGGVRDVSAFANLRAEAGLQDVIAICDKGFAKKSDQDEMERCGTKYLIPLRRNSGEYSREPLERPGFDGFQGRFLYNGRIIWHAAQPAAPGAGHRIFLYLDETLRHAEQSAPRGADIGGETERQLERVKSTQKLAGTICLKTSMDTDSAEDVYRTYKVREEVEQLFDTYKAELDFNTTGMHSAETLEACLFVNHLALLMAYRVYERLRDNGRLREYAAVKILGQYLWDVRVSNFGDGWRLEPIPKAARKAFEALGLTPPTEAILNLPMG